VRTSAFNHLFTLLKFALWGFVGGVGVVTLVFMIVDGPSSLISNNSSWLGTEKHWARIMLRFLVVRGALCGLAIGLVAGLIKIVVVSRRGNSI
jgi:hypothetical protein